MSVLQRESENESEAKVTGRNNAEQGKTYEQLLFTLLAKKGFELSKDGKFKDGEFSIGRELNMMLDVKFDDIVFSYKGMDDTKNLVFVQVKHMQNENQVINYKILSTEEWKAKGNLQENFNLQKYFISFLRIREELKDATSEELKDGEIKYVAIYTNIGLNAENLDLKSNDDDDSLNHIKSIFSFEKFPIDCYQLNSLSDELRSILEKSSDLHRIARELAQFLVWENHRKKNTKTNTEEKEGKEENAKITILGKEENAVHLYQVALEREVIKKSPEKLSIKNEKYCLAYFRDDFIDNEEPGSKKELRDAIFQAMTELTESETDTSEIGLKSILRKVEMKVTPNFGKIKHKKTTLPCEWMAVTKSDIDDFLKCFVFLVNQPNVTRLITLIHPEKDSILKGSHVGQVFDNMFPKLRERIEKELGFHEKASRKEVWLSGEKIIQYVQEQEEAVNISIMTSFYENSVMKYGEFIHLGELEAILDSFLGYKMSKEEVEMKELHLLLKESKVLSVCSEITLLSTIKILQFLNAKNYREENCYISIELDKLVKRRDRVEKAFSSETYKLLIIECRHKINKQHADEICRGFSTIIENKRNKKIILINKQGEPNVLAERFRFYLKKLFQNDRDPEKVYVEETDDINLEDFVPADDPFKKNVIVFKGQEEKVSLARLTDFQDWKTYVDHSYQDIIPNKSIIADLMFEILDEDIIEVGNKPLGTSSLEGAYATLFEKINSVTLMQRLLGNKNYENKTLEDDILENDIYVFSTIFEEINSDSVTKNLDNGTNEIYIFDGVKGSNRTEKIEKLEEYLGLDNGRKRIDNMVGNIDSDSKIQIVDDEADDEPFTEESFKKVCCNHPNKKIFWIHMKDKENAELQQFYNPEFYLQRHFKNVIIKKEVIEDLIHGRLSEIFILYPVNNEEELIQSLNFTDVNVIGRSLINCEDFNIKLCALENDVEATFQEFCKCNETVHCLKLEDEQLLWCQSHGSLNTLRKYIDREQGETSLIEEDDLIKEIKDRKVVIIADDPGMGKTTTITKLYESNAGSASFVATHWIIRINFKYHLQAIRDIYGTISIINIADFLSNIDLKLNNNVARSLLILALSKNKYFPKPLLLVFDGFDEILNRKDRNKMITLMKFLKNETTAKLWITTRLHYKKTLEDELSTFAFEFTPMNDKIAYIKNYLKHRLYFILNSKDFAEFFPNNDEINENERLQKYTNAFFKKMESIFKENVFRFIGTPLQLYLMLEGSPRHFKIWIENDLDENLDFEYLGNDILKIYQTFIHRKYDIYFKTMGINDAFAQAKDNYIFDEFSEDFAKSLILKSKPKISLQKFKETVLAVGVIKSNGNNIDFIHTTFTDYFAAEVFIHWLKETPNVVSNTSKLEYLLKEIFKKPDFQLIRTFINLKLKNNAKNCIPKETLKQYGKSIEMLLSDKQSPFVDEVGTVLHIAVEEGNTSIICFLLNSLKELTETLKQFLFTRNKQGKTVLHLACKGFDYEIVNTLLDNAERISKDTLEEFLNILDDNKLNALDEAVCKSENARIVNELLNKAKNKLDLMMNARKRESSLILACKAGKERVVKVLVHEFKGDDKGLKQLLLFNGECGNVLYCAALKSRAIVNYLLLIAKSINDNNETFKKLLLPKEGDLPLKKAIQKGNIAAIETLINAAKDFGDDNYTLEKMILSCVSIEPDLLISGKKQRNVMKALLETAASLGNEVFEKFIFDLIATDKIFLHAIFRNSDEKVFADSFKMLELDKYQCLREKLIEIYNSTPLEEKLRFDKKILIGAIKKKDLMKVKDILDSAKHSKNNPKEKLRILLLPDDNEKFRSNVLHDACRFRNTTIINELISCVIEIDDNGKMLQELISSRNCSKKTPIQMLGKKDANRVKKIMHSLIFKAINDNNALVTNILQKILNEMDN